MCFAAAEITVLTPQMRCGDRIWQMPENHHFQYTATPHCTSLPPALLKQMPPVHMRRAARTAPPRRCARKNPKNVIVTPI